MEYDDETIGFQAQPMEEDPEPQTNPSTYDMVSNSAGGYSYAVNDATRKELTHDTPQSEVTVHVGTFH
jgi:hypothetical protein